MKTVGVVGLGYVGLPLAVEFARHYDTIGYDLSKKKVEQLARGVDVTGEVTAEQFKAATRMRFVADPAALAEADVLIVAVPTPVDEAHRPDFSPLIGASEICGRHMKRGATVVFESTVYPGATEEICVPVLEKISGMKWKTDFHVGYSPERINPGDRLHTLTRIVKVVSGDDQATLDMVAELYGSIIEAGVHRASSIKVAEAAKVIENTQRDLNIALMNELSFIFDRVGIDTLEVLEAAGTKWNFLPFRPGLVGGHCIGVDPYYLTTKAEMVGYHPQVILAGRRINDAMGPFVARRTIKEMVGLGFPVNDSPIVVLGLTFKENVPDLRNSKVIDLIREFRSYGAKVYVHDPVASPEDAMHEFGIELTAWEDLPVAGALVLAVNHREFVERPLEGLLEKSLAGGVVADVKGALDVQAVKATGRRVWRL
ncbi:MAG: nucleotide sugar dehydrogenase [Burkholderiaceae bacterium]|nr:nucleotide sugar dehydrogenase [Burkholderiaceae bacterium]